MITAGYFLQTCSYLNSIAVPHTKLVVGHTFEVLINSCDLIVQLNGTRQSRGS